MWQRIVKQFKDPDFEAESKEYPISSSFCREPCWWNISFKYHTLARSAKTAVTIMHEYTSINVKCKHHHFHKIFHRRRLTPPVFVDYIPSLLVEIGSCYPHYCWLRRVFRWISPWLLVLDMQEFVCLSKVSRSALLSQRFTFPTFPHLRHLLTGDLHHRCLAWEPARKLLQSQNHTTWSRRWPVDSFDQPTTWGDRRWRWCFTPAVPDSPSEIPSV